MGYVIVRFGRCELHLRMMLTVGVHEVEQYSNLEL